MTLAFLLAAFAIFTAACLHLYRRSAVLEASKPAPARPPGRTLAAPAAARNAALERIPTSPASMSEPRLEMLEWDMPPDESGASPMAPAQARIRDRYLAARFDGAIRGAGDLCLAEHVIDVARLYFEEGRAEFAHELLALAIAVAPQDARLRLAGIEIAFLTRDGDTFLAAARALDLALPGCPQWRDVQRLGRALLPQEPLFGAAGGPRAHEHYGAWPDTPNWIGASWDLTGDVHAADFHLAMSRGTPDERPAFRSAA